MKSKKNPTAVETGQIYRAPRRGKPARHIRIVKVTKLASAQPFAYSREVTRSGNLKPGESVRHFLVWDSKRWSLAPWYELVAP